MKVMPDYIKIHEPKDDEREIVPGVQFAQRREEAPSRSPTMSLNLLRGIP